MVGLGSNSISIARGSMRVALLSGAYKNAGDFLIERRCRQLLEYVYPGCETIALSRKTPLIDRLAEINETDAVVLSGGPALLSNIYPNKIPLVPDLTSIRPPIFAMALGIMLSGSARILQKYEFSETTRRLWQRICSDGYSIGCRDNNSADLMRRSGYQATMTGCAAWFDIPNVSQKTLQSHGYKKIVVSDPALMSNHRLVVPLLRYLLKNATNADILFVFHRGTKSDSETGLMQATRLANLEAQVQELGITCKDIAYSADGFEVYDDCDLHVGFRVHAHIYTLSKRRQSILISEDLRGSSFNQTVGLPYIESHDERYTQVSNRYARGMFSSIADVSNPFLLQELDNVFELIETTKGRVFEWAFERMEFYFQDMIEHIRTLERLS